MNILFLTHRLPYAPNRGDRIRAYHMLRQLSGRHRIDLVSLVHDAEEASHAHDLESMVDSVTVARTGRIRGAVRAGAALLHRQPLTHALLDAPRFTRLLARTVDRVRPDLVLAYCSGMARFALAPPLDRFPFVLDMVDVDSSKWQLLAARRRPPMRWVYAREARELGAFERIAVHAARATLVVNDREREMLCRIAGEAAPVAVVPNGVDLKPFCPQGPPAADERVVFCGVMNYEPNETAALWLAREVWPRVRRVRPGAQLTLLGARPTRRLLELPRTDASIEVTGRVPDVRPYLWRSALSVAPLAVARGVQNKVLEATAAGLPSVVTGAVLEGLPPEVSPACRRADGASEFAEAILQLLARSPAERRRLAERAVLEPLDWSHRLASLDFILHHAARRPERCSA